MAQVIKTERRSSKVSQRSNDESEKSLKKIEVTNKADLKKANNVIELENSYGSSEQVSHHYSTGELKDETDKPAGDTKAKFSNPKTKESSLENSENKNMEGFTHGGVSNDVSKQINAEKELKVKHFEDKSVEKASTDAGENKVSEAISQEDE